MSKTNFKNHVRNTKTHSPSTNAAHARVREMARQQGVQPIKSIKELQGDFWPEDESVDKFLDLVRRIRHQDDVSHRISE